MGSCSHRRLGDPSGNRLCTLGLIRGLLLLENLELLLGRSSLGYDCQAVGDFLLTIERRCVLGRHLNERSQHFSDRDRPCFRRERRFNAVFLRLPLVLDRKGAVQGRCGTSGAI